MRNIFWAAMLSAGLQGCGIESEQLSESKNVFGFEDRVPLVTEDRPWTAIGKVLDVGCTGTLVHRDLVLTAAHCIVDQATKQRRTDVRSFAPNYKEGKFEDEATISEVWLGTEDPWTFLGKDWALLRISKPLGDKYGWIGVARFNVETFPTKMSVIGYGQNFRDGQTAGAHNNCDLRKRDVANNLILNDCDAGPGNSGSPVLVMSGQQMTVGGVFVAERRDGGSASLYVDVFNEDYANLAIPATEVHDKIMEIIN